MHRKILISILIFMILLPSVVCYASEQTNTIIKNNSKYQVIIEDDADLLTSDEEQTLYTQMTELTQYGNILFKTISINPYSSTEKYASTYYHEKCQRQSGTVFLIDMQKRIIYIYSDGSNYTTITSEKAEIITDNIYRYATKKQYYKCATEAFSQINTLLKGGKIAEPMKYISNAVIAVMLALFINFTIFKLATRNKTASNKEQIKECERFFKYSKPEVKKSGEHKVYSPMSSGSSSGGGGGFSGGGRRWPVVVAGGGGHSF